MTDEERALAFERLKQAEAAWHDLNLGMQARVFVDQNGERVEYTPASRSGLRAYIMELKSALGMKTGASAPMGARIIR
jgi:hypothetical protein